MKLEIAELQAGYGNGTTVIEDINLKVAEGEIVTLIGANGSGKSTILKTIGRLLKPVAGGVYLDGREVHAWKTGTLARKLAVLPQVNVAPDDLTVQDLVEYGRYPYRRRFHGLSEHDHYMVDRALRLTHLETFRERLLTTLSGGECQRAWIAMTLAQEPKILLLDEPTTFLDVCHQLEIIELITRMNRDLGLTIIMVLHDLNLAARCSHRLVAIKDKHIYRVGTSTEVMTVPILKELFNINAKIVMGDDGIPFFIPLGSCSVPT